MKLQQLRYVVKVAECGSITEASRRLFVSQPSITASIRDLENEMGVHIFERTNKGVVVSEEGETFLGYARQVLDQADLLEGKYKGASEQVPHFSVSCQHYSFAVNAFVDVIREFDAARYDYVVDAIDTLSPKLALIAASLERGYPLVSSMGAGAKTDPTKLEIADISKTHHCPLAHMLRKRLHKIGIRSGFRAVFSPEPMREGAMILCEEQNKKSNVGTISYIPPLFGIGCASVVIRGLIGELD